MNSIPSEVLGFPLSDKECRVEISKSPQDVSAVDCGLRSLMAGCYSNVTGSCSNWSHCRYLIDV
jgi:hypothetical protein